MSPTVDGKGYIALVLQGFTCAVLARKSRALLSLPWWFGRKSLSVRACPVCHFVECIYPNMCRNPIPSRRHTVGEEDIIGGGVGGQASTHRQDGRETRRPKTPAAPVTKTGRNGTETGRKNGAGNHGKKFAAYVDQEASPSR